MFRLRETFGRILLAENFGMLHRVDKSCRDGESPSLFSCKEDATHTDAFRAARESAAPGTVPAEHELRQSRVKIYSVFGGKTAGPSVDFYAQSDIMNLLGISQK